VDHTTIVAIVRWNCWFSVVSVFIRIWLNYSHGTWPSVFRNRTANRALLFEFMHAVCASLMAHHSTMPPDGAAYSKFSNTGIRIRPPLWNRIEWARTTFEYESNIESHHTACYIPLRPSLPSCYPPPLNFLKIRALVINNVNFVHVLWTFGTLCTDSLNHW